MYKHKTNLVNNYTPSSTLPTNSADGHKPNADGNGDDCDANVGSDVGMRMRRAVYIKRLWARELPARMRQSRLCVDSAWTEDWGSVLELGPKSDSSLNLSLTLCRRSVVVVA